MALPLGEVSMAWALALERALVELVLVELVLVELVLDELERVEKAACEAASLTQPTKPQNSKASAYLMWVRSMEFARTVPATRAGTDAALDYLVVEVEDEPMPDCEPELDVPPVPIDEAPVLPVVPDELDEPPGMADDDAPVLPEVPLLLEAPPAGAVDELLEAPDEPMPELLDEPDDGDALEEPEASEEPEAPDEPEAPEEPVPELLYEPDERSGAVEDPPPDP